MAATTHRESLNSAFLRAVCEAPGEDFPRLVYADWLEENAGTVPCDKCGGEGWSSDWQGGPGSSKCYTCRATGRVPDGRKERAEFVRVQCELACHCPPLSPPVNGVRSGLLCGACEREHYRPDEYAALRRRERELLPVFYTAFLASVGIKPAYYQSASDTADVDRDGRCHAVGVGGTVSVTFLARRGFVAEVTLGCADFAGGVCERCNGDGKAHGSDRPFEWSDDPLYMKCPVCKGTGRTPGHAGALFAAAPIEKVTLTDRTPGHVIPAHGTSFWRWYDGSLHYRGGREYVDFPPNTAHDEIPGSLWKVYDELIAAQEEVTWEHRTKEEALQWLSAACVTFGRLAASLPPPAKDGAR